MFGSYNGVLDGGRRACSPRRPGAQPQGHHCPAPAERTYLHHGAFRFREVEPCLRHDLRRGPAPLRRIAVRVRAPVPADDGEAGRRFDRRPQPGDLDRPEDHVAQPAFDRRHGDGDLRLLAAALRARRPAALPRLRASDLRPVDRLDRRADPDAVRGHALHGQRADRARPQGRVQGSLRGAPQRGLHAHQGRRRAAHARGAADARQEVQAHDRSRRRPSGDEGRPAHPAHAERRDRARAGGRADRDRPRRRGRGAHLQPELRVPRARRLAARAAAAHLLVQLAARRVPALYRPRRAAGDRPGPARARPVALDRRGRARPVGRRRQRFLRIGDPGDRRPVRDPDRRRVAGPHRGGAGLFPLRHRRREGLRAVPQPDGPAPLVHDRLRGDHLLARAPLPRDRLVDAARAHRGVHVVSPLPGLQGRAPQARGARGDGQRQKHSRVHEVLDHPRPAVPERPRPDRDGAVDRPPHRQGDSRAADVPRRRRRRLPEPRSRERDALGG